MYVPAVHAVHWLVPTVGAKKPGEHAVQALALVMEA